MCGVHVVIVTAAPKEGLAVRNNLNVVSIDEMTLKNRPFIIAKIAADNADGINGRKETSGQAKVRRRTAKDTIAFAKRRFQRVKRDRTNYC
jgi:hypothetical protein